MNSTKLLLLAIIPLLLTSCGSSGGVEVKEREIQPVTDYYRNNYQIFPISFADSNGDGKGDLQGIIDKFDYITSLNMNGLWLTPIHKSNSYHKYDVLDYKSIDPTFGTLDTYDALVKKAHDNGVIMILDLVLNHSASGHPWFIECMNAHINGETNNRYYNYYVVEDYTGTVPDGYSRYQRSDYIYECRFWDGMPDFNLQGVIDGTNTNLINDFKDIMKFWLVDHNVDGLRLDACTSFFTGNIDKNIEFLNWVKKTAEEIKPNTYVIGEVLESSSTYSRYYNSNADSFFAFDDALKNVNAISWAMTTESVYKVNSFISKDIRATNGHIPAPLVANHDIGRSYKQDIADNKLLHGLLAVDAGATFEYYGEEVGMKSLTVDTKDEDYRQPIPWGDEYTCTPVSGSTSGTDAEKYPLGSIKEQDNDEHSMLNYFRKAYRYRLENPELARGSTSLYYENEEGNAGIIEREYNGSKVYLAMNLSNTVTSELDISDLGEVEIVGDLSVGTSLPSRNGTKLKMTPRSLLILH